MLTFYAPDAHMVGVAGSFNDWNPLANPLEHTADGVWADDPQAAQRVANPYGGLNSVVNVRLDDRTDLL